MSEHHRYILNCSSSEITKWLKFQWQNILAENCPCSEVSGGDMITWQKFLALEFPSGEMFGGEMSSGEMSGS